MIIKANAKITLSVQVLNNAEANKPKYKMIMLPLKLCDILEINFLPSRFDNLINFAEASTAVSDSNMAIRTINELQEHYNLKDKMHITIHKHIPTNAGLGGGSSNAAAIINALGRRLDPKLTREDSLKIAVKIGEEVPFCLDNIPAVVEGQGDILTPIRLENKPFVLLVKPNVDTPNTTILAPKIDIHNEGDHFDLAIDALKKGDLYELSKHLVNDLEEIVLEKEESIRNLKNLLKKEDVPVVMMSGSGSTVFVLSFEKAKLKHLESKYRHLGYDTTLTSVL